MSLAEPILQLDGAPLPIEPGSRTTVPIDLTVAAGELLLIDLVGPRRAAAFADAIAGLLPPIAGRVLFEGRDWQEMPQPAAEALRGRIGRAYRDDLWLPFLSVPENIFLLPSYHTCSARSGLLTEASRPCQLLGLPGVPSGYSSDLFEDTLRRPALARAFVGSPRLVVFEHPTERLGLSLLSPILRLARLLRDEGGALLWLVFGDARDVAAAVQPSLRLRLSGTRIVPVSRVTA